MLKVTLVLLAVCIIGIWSINQTAYGDVSSITIISSQNPASSGQFVTFTANISPSTATGTIQFEETNGGQVFLLGTGTLSNGVATFSTSSLSVGSHNIIANYLGDGLNTASTSRILTQTISQGSSISNPLTPQSSVSSQPFVPIPQTNTIKIDTVPRVASIVVDDTLYLATDLPLQFQWKTGSTHTVTIVDTTINNAPGSRYLFDTWTDQITDSSRDVNVQGDMSYRAIFKTQNYLQINSDYGKVKGEGWYDNGQVAEFSLSQATVTDSDNLQQHMFDSWSDGNNKKSLKASIIVDHPITIDATWKNKYYIQLKSSLPDIQIPGTGWYNDGDKVPLVTVGESTVNQNTKYAFDKWVLLGDTASVIDNPSTNVATLTVNGPQIVEANWSKDYYVAVFSNYGDTTGSGYYADGSTASISVSTTEVIIKDKVHKVEFNGWSVTSVANNANAGGANSLSGSQSSLNNSPLTQYPNSQPSTSDGQQAGSDLSGQNAKIIVDGPKMISANWKDQYYLNVNTKQGTVTGTGWYDSGQPGDIVVSPPTAPPGVWVRYVFDGWSGDYQGTSTASKVIMNGPKNVDAAWRADYTPAIMNSVIMSAVGAGGFIVYRKTKKNTVGGIMNKTLPRPTTNEDEMAVASEFPEERPTKRTQFPRHGSNPTEYQYALFDPKEERPPTNKGKTAAASRFHLQRPPKRTQFPRHGSNPTEYQYALFDPREEGRS